MVLEYTKSDVEEMERIASLEILAMKKNIRALESIIENAQKDIPKNIQIANGYLLEGKTELYDFLMRESIPGNRKLIHLCKKSIDECKLNISIWEEKLKHYHAQLEEGKMPLTYSYHD
jgi:hypothetical protein